MLPQCVGGGLSRRLDEGAALKEHQHADPHAPECVGAAHDGNAASGRAPSTREVDHQTATARGSSPARAATPAPPARRQAVAQNKPDRDIGQEC
jgi:hypothetical protein